MVLVCKLGCFGGFYDIGQPHRTSHRATGVGWEVVCQAETAVLTSEKHRKPSQ